MQKTKLYNVNAREKTAAALPPHVEAISGDGTGEVCLGEVVVGGRRLGDQAMAGYWPEEARIFGIKRGRKFEFLKHKSTEFLNVFG